MNISLTSIIGPFVAFTATALLIMLLKPIAKASGLVDVPNKRSSHSQPTPLIGGLSIYIAVASAYSIPATMGLMPFNRETGSFFLAGLVVVIVGVIDDYRPLPSSYKFLAQIVASLIMIFGARVVLDDLGGMTLSGDVSIPWLVVYTVHHIRDTGCYQCTEYV